MDEDETVVGCVVKIPPLVTQDLQDELHRKINKYLSDVFGSSGCEFVDGTLSYRLSENAWSQEKLVAPLVKAMAALKSYGEGAYESHEIYVAHVDDLLNCGRSAAMHDKG